MFLDVTFVDLRRTGQSSAQRMPGKQRAAFLCGQVCANAALQHSLLDQARHMFVIQPIGQGAFAVARCAGKDRAKVDPRRAQSVFERMHRVA